MSWRTNRAVLLLRNLGRMLGLNRLVGSLLAGKGYEDRFQAAMLGCDSARRRCMGCGRQRGPLFQKIFGYCGFRLERCLHYEPSPANLQRLNAAVASLANVTVLPGCAGKHEGVVVLEQGDDPLGATSRIVDEGS